MCEWINPAISSFIDDQTEIETFINVVERGKKILPDRVLNHQPFSRTYFFFISVKIFFDLTLVPPVKIPIFMYLLPRLIARASQPDGNMTSFTLHFSRLM